MQRRPLAEVIICSSITTPISRVQFPRVGWMEPLDACEQEILMASASCPFKELQWPHNFQEDDWVKEPQHVGLQLQMSQGFKRFGGACRGSCSD